MGFFDKLFGKSKVKTNQEHGDSHATEAESHLKRAVDIADREIALLFYNKIRARTGNIDSYRKIQTELDVAVKLCPSVPEYRYLLADAKINAGLRKDGREEIVKLAEEYPDYVEAQGFAKATSLNLNWLSPFDYVRWNTTMKKLPDGLSSSDTGGCLPVTMLRDGARRVVSFVGNIPRQSLPPNLHEQLRTTIRLNCMTTPYATIVRAYVLIDTDPREPYTSEQLINIEHYSADPKNTTDFAHTGYYLIQLLASQPYTYVVINDPQQGVFFNRKLEITGDLAGHLNDVSAKIKKLALRQEEDPLVFLKANQHYFDHSSVDDILF